MFADDICMAATDPNEVQIAVSALSIWCDDAGMRAKIAKTKMMEFRQLGTLGKTTIFYKQRII